MGCDCCGPPAPTPEPVAAPIAAPIEGDEPLPDSCCDDGDSDSDAEPLETKDPGQGQPNQEKPDDCCSSGKCADNEAKDDTDTHDCCRGKVGPC